MWALPRRARAQPTRAGECDFLLGLDVQITTRDLSFSGTSAVACTAGMGLAVWKFVLSHKMQAVAMEQPGISTLVAQGEGQDTETDCHDEDDEVETQTPAEVEDTPELESVDTEDDGEGHKDSIETLDTVAVDADCPALPPQVVTLDDLEAASSTHDLPPALTELLSTERSGRKTLLLKDSSQAWETASDMTEWSSIVDDDECHSASDSRRSHRSKRWRAVGYGRYMKI